MRYLKPSNDSRGGIADTAQVIEDGLAANPDVRLVLEIALRAREVESKEPPRNIGVATDIVATPTNSQCLGPSSTSGWIRTA
jgi:hypothetical protein